MPLPLLATKFYPPALRSNLVARPRLMARLAEGLQRQLTLVSAPAGFGKTTLLSEWRSGPGCEPALAWLTLDDGDNDPVRFWSYVLTALEQAAVPIDAATKTLLQSSPPQVEAALTHLVNTLAAVPRPIDRVLALDDYHVIRAEAVHGSLTFFLEHLPPTLHLIMLSRADPQLPLARLRVRNQLVELRASDLRCTLEETNSFFTQAAGLTLSDRAMEALHARTEGWLAGLQLAALSMKDLSADQVDAFIAGLTGTHHHILDYLTEEVLQRQPDGVREFLLKTSILQQLNAPLCEAVTGQAQGRAMLEQLEHANLFIDPLDAAGEWYRYHRLFADVLQTQLQQTQPELMLELHRRACEWYAQHGYIVEAMRHALAAQQFERAADLLEREYRVLISRGELVTVRGWLDALPRELVQARTRLNFAYAYASVYTSRYDEMEHYLAQAEAALPAAAPADQTMLRGELYTLRGIAQAVRGDAQALESARAGLALIPADDPYLQLLAHHALGSGYRLLGRPIEAEPALLRVLELARPLNSSMGLIVGNVRLGQIRMLRGHLRQALQALNDALSCGRELGGNAQLYTGEAHIRVGDLYREWNELDLALEHIAQGIELARRANPVALLTGYFTLLRIQWACGETNAAGETLRQAEQLAARFDFPHLTERVAAHRAWLDSMRGDDQALHVWANAYLAVRPAAREPSEGFNDLQDTLLARILIRHDRARDAQPLLESLRAEAEATGRGWTLIQTLALLALSFEKQRQPDRALNTLAQAIALAEPEGFIRVFADEGQALQSLLSALRSRLERTDRQQRSAYLNKLLAAFPVAELGTHVPQIQNPKSKIQNLIEPLTPREIEILQLLASGASNQQIADRLVIGLGTVKAHVNHIFGKLSAHNRVEAIAKARTLGLVD